ncbi:hypothetical protein [Siculibacillus lacustris]|uniref:hypothetical protein n=1 Tax=Siculibacillus lacustris TaxID=1549641 RepID=UPI0013F17619|nr:hypothetical protein [Siculibacillus lacustris]
MVSRSFGIGSAFLAFAVLVGTASAQAQPAVMKACGAEWQAAKAAGKVKPGETWQTFLADCRTRQAATPAVAPAPVAPAPAAVAPAAPAKPVVAAPAAVPAKPVAAAPAAVAPAKPAVAAAPATPGLTGKAAANARIKQCGAEWKAAKEAGKIPAGQKWPQYWSECNTRLKAAGQ